MYRSRRRTFFVAIIIACLLGMSGSAVAAAQVEADDDQSTWDQIVQVGLIYSHFDAVFNDLDADAAARLVGENAVIETPLGSFTGPDGLIAFVSILHRANPDAVFGITSATVGDEGVRIEWRMSALSYKSDPNETAAAVIVERFGTATITFEDQVVSAASLDYETAVSPMPSQETAGIPSVAGRPGVAY